MISDVQPTTIDTCIAKLSRKPLPLDRSATLEDDLDLDIVDFMTLACELEETFLVEIPDVEISAWTTVEDVHRTITALLSTTTLNLTEEAP